MDNIVSKYASINISKSLERIGSEEICKKLFAILLETLPEDQNKLINAINAGDASLARSIIHKMHGGLTYCQSPQYNAILLEIRETVCENKISAAKSLIKNLTIASEQLLIDIENYCHND